MSTLKVAPVFCFDCWASTVGRETDVANIGAAGVSTLVDLSNEGVGIVGKANTVLYLSVSKSRSKEKLTL